MIYSASPIASASAVNVEAILDILNFMLRPSFICVKGILRMVCLHFWAVRSESFAGSHSFLDTLAS
jgi:hypothetical protein